MSNINQLSVLLNSSVGALINQTEKILNETQPQTVTTHAPSVVNSTVLPYNSTSWYPNTNTTTNGSLPWYYNNTNYWNNTIYYPPLYTPYYPDFVTVDPPVITYSYTYSYVYYVLLLVLFVVAIICIKIGISRRKEMERRNAAQRRRALQQTQTAYCPTNSNNTSSNNCGNNNVPKASDLPPAYDDVIQSYMLAKSLENTSNDCATGMTTNPSSNTISTAVSTLTIETEISNSNYASAVNLNNPSTSSIMTETETCSAIINTSLPLTSQSQPPSYDHIEAEILAKEANSDRIV